MKRVLFRYLFAVVMIVSLLLSGCQAATPTPAAEDLPPVITAENIGELTIVEKIGYGEIYGAALSPDEKILAVSTTSGVLLFNKTSMELIEFIDLPFLLNGSTFYRSSTNNIAFSPDGKQLALAYDAILIWDIAEKKVIRRFENQLAGSPIYHISYSPIGNSLLVISDGAGNVCDGPSISYQIFELDLGWDVFTKSYCAHVVYHNAFFLENGNLVIIGYPATMRSPFEVLTLDTNDGEVISLEKENDAFSTSIDPLGIKRTKQYSFWEGPTVILRNDTAQVISKLTGNAGFLHSAKTILLEEDENFNFSVINDEFVPICSFPSDFYYDFYFYKTYAFMYGYQLPIINQHNDGIDIWDFSTCEKTQELDFPPSVISILIGSSNPEIGFGDYLELSELENDTTTLQNNETNFSKLIYVPHAFIPNEPKIISTNAEDCTKPLNILNYSTNQTSEIKVIFPSCPTYFQISKDGQVLGAITYSGIFFINLQTDEMIGQILYDKPRRFIFLSDLDTVAYVYNNRFVVVDYTTGIREKDVLIPTFIESNYASFSPDGELFTVGSETGIEIWNTDGKKVIDLEEFPRPLSMVGDYNQEDVYGIDRYSNYYEAKYYYTSYRDLTISVDSDFLVTNVIGENINLLRFWSIESGKQIRDIILPFYVDSIALSTDGRSIYTSVDGLIYVWQIVE